jgi:hydroxymethylpyrimidine kinase/phosphomethylpyrimidine kinase/thiamine-phosphate diphosphorylase
MMQTHRPGALPLLSWNEEPVVPVPAAGPMRRLDLYAIVNSADRLRQVLAVGVKTVQLRIKTPEQPSPEWFDTLRSEVRRSVQASDAAGAELFINDHWRIAAEAGARGVHLGQDDLLALGAGGRKELQATGMALGVSSHSLWELCRARALTLRYIACGPVWPTLTKAMPWRPRDWTTCRGGAGLRRCRWSPSAASCKRTRCSRRRAAVPTASASCAAWASSRRPWSLHCRRR